MAEPRIIVDPNILAGKPVIRGTRLAVDFIVGLLADGWTQAEIERQYPGVTTEDIAACLAYARDVLGAERVYVLD
ncbi:MAG: antitoxin [Proteobacteria bacterium HN_bin10]|nr:MAG: antitoxin [Proteobacteria bacterium HN_bin10]